MPYMKAIAGHKGLRRLANYLTKGGRALAFDSLNVVEFERSRNGDVRWDQVMDETRRLCRNDWTDGARVRTYNHYIISLDPRDSVDLFSFRLFVEDWAERWFDGELGTFQVAIVYHDDNSERVSRGERGILHAHVVVNNTELKTGKRLAPLLTNQVVQEMRVDLERAAYDLGWHSFSEDMRSMTPEEMRAAGVGPTTTRGESVKRLIEREARAADTASRAAAARPVVDERHGADAGARPLDAGGRIGEDTSALDALMGSFTAEDRERALREAGRVGHWVDLGDGRLAVLPVNVVEGHQASRETMAERGHRARKGWSWKQDVRDRVDVAVKLATTRRDFIDVLSGLGVEVSRTRDGEVKYSDAMGLGKTVRGDTLGADYTGAAIEQRLSERASSTRKGNVGPGSGALLNTAARHAIARGAAEIEPGSREGAERLADVDALIGYIESHGVESYGDFGDDEPAQEMLDLARSLGALDDGPAVATGDLERLEQRALERARRGEGGTEADAVGGGAQEHGEDETGTEAAARER